MNDETLEELRSFVVMEGRNLAQEVRDYLEKEVGPGQIFRNTDIHKHTQIYTISDNAERQRQINNISIILKRLSDDGAVRRHGKRAGEWRKISGDLIKMDFLKADREEYSIVFPFDIPIRVFPGNILVIAGQTNAGKTSLLLNIIRLNMHDKEIHYFNCEMGNAELAERLEAFEDLELDDWNFTPYERQDNFADVIQPNALNIVDYLDDSEAYYMKDRIKEIHNMIQNQKGVVIIAQQKHKYKEYGYGGEHTSAIPRLYMTLGWDDDKHSGIVKLMKVKNKRPGDDNPNGKMRRYWIYDKGSRWEVDEPWRYPEDDEMVNKSNLSRISRR